MDRDFLTDLYAAAAARIVLTCRTSVVTACGDRTLTSEVMTVNRLTAAEDLGLEAAAASVIGCQLPLADRDDLVPPTSQTVVDDPEVLLAWLLTDGLTTFH